MSKQTGLGWTGIEVTAVDDSRPVFVACRAEHRGSAAFTFSDAGGGGGSVYGGIASYWSGGLGFDEPAARAACSYCRTVLPPGRTHCGQCGAPLKG